MALLFDTPFPFRKDNQSRFFICRMISNLDGDKGKKELEGFCRSHGVDQKSINNGMAHISGRQIYAARLAGAREISPEHMDQLIRSMNNG